MQSKDCSALIPEQGLLFWILEQGLLLFRRPLLVLLKLEGVPSKDCCYQTHHESRVAEDSNGVNARRQFGSMRKYNVCPPASPELATAIG